MRKIRIYQKVDLDKHQQIQLDATASNHLCNVLRLKTNDDVYLFNGDGKEYKASITVANKRSTVLDIKEHFVINNESPINIHLAQGISRGDRMDYAIQKAVELGVNIITPVISKHCSVKLNSKNSQSKYNHWQKIIISATEQCGRCIIPTLNQPVALDEWLSYQDDMIKLVLSPKAKTKLKDLSKNLSSLTLVIGPEGGLSQEEIESCLNHGFQDIQLGPRILRTETAATATVAAIQCLFGDT